MPTPKEKVIALLNSLNTGGLEPIIYINPNRYIQHNLAVIDSLARFTEIMENLSSQGFSTNEIRDFPSGNYLITHI